MRVDAGPRLNDGSPWTPKRFSAQRRRVHTGRDQKVRFHDLRHTHATLLLRQGIHPKVVLERLGHSTIDITLDTYSHVMPHMPDEAAEKLDGVLKAAMGAASRNQS
jgi:integrase